MKISVIGCGYLGAVHAACMASLGHDVVGIDTDADKVATLSSGRTPFYEPGLAEILEPAVRNNKLRFVTGPAPQELATSDVIFIAVGTPQSKDSPAADLTYLEAAFKSVFDAMPTETSAVIVGKSTVPVGTAERFARQCAERGLTLVWNPEFLREGFAVEDTLHPDRIVYGLAADETSARHGESALDAVYERILAEGMPKLVTNYPTAELVKVAANSFLATKISFINAMAELCEATGGDVTQLAQALGHDDRIGHKFLRAGIGFGGGCLPKDIRAFVARAEELGVHEAVTFLKEVDSINQRRRDRVVAEAKRTFDGDVEGAKITVLGAAFKPNSDDIRDSPALEIAQRLHNLGAKITVCDPKALESTNRAYPDLHTEADIATALTGAELVLLLTEWKEFLALDPASTATLVKEPVIIDGRNALNPKRWRAAGWAYSGLGR
ncbi:UDP-glucose/GDP-mannose dehydrogenase family protein [Corynebacterium canis]|uniref:UDP-glucose 6-dehydrogenase n=1 Tax=Corynebacterium canis TaxID=679663 RepID=A0A5C5URE1_9CORY|nr:UDP-glucose/GDP-mannose dehydrogenase family protein [Corynebacterium canis]TWT28756.1 UDP-glucose/GDP-mannose dehydrogenase family protein [Corynebacterium canis]WJY75664.1 UDP-glucose 6-dehydrogenase TuaD [Corynebacterium canis]